MSDVFHNADRPKSISARGRLTFEVKTAEAEGERERAAGRIAISCKHGFRDPRDPIMAAEP